MLELLIVAAGIAAVGLCALWALKFVRRHVSRTGPTRVAPPLQMSAASLTQVQQDTSRAMMELEVAQDRERRGATDMRP